MGQDVAGSTAQELASAIRNNAALIDRTIKAFQHQDRSELIASSRRSAPSRAQLNMHAPYAGLKIVDLFAVVSGPMAAGMLADQGAELIKVERPRATSRG